MSFPGSEGWQVNRWHKSMPNEAFIRDTLSNRKGHPRDDNLSSPLLLHHDGAERAPGWTQTLDTTAHGSIFSIRCITGSILSQRRMLPITTGFPASRATCHRHGRGPLPRSGRCILRDGSMTATFFPGARRAIACGMP